MVGHFFGRSAGGGGLGLLLLLVVRVIFPEGATLDIIAGITQPSFQLLPPGAPLSLIEKRFPSSFLVCAVLLI